MQSGGTRGEDRVKRCPSHRGAGRNRNAAEPQCLSVTEDDVHTTVQFFAPVLPTFHHPHHQQWMSTRVNGRGIISLRTLKRTS